MALPWLGLFLATVICQRIALDLGESLEAAAPGWLAFSQALATLADELDTAAAAIPMDHPGAGQWQGLAGWVWVTRFLENMLQHFQKTRTS